MTTPLHPDTRAAIDRAVRAGLACFRTGRQPPRHSVPDRETRAAIDQAVRVGLAAFRQPVEHQPDTSLEQCSSDTPNPDEDSTP